jgi:L-lysine exporter family protein LysE/ArgO
MDAYLTGFATGAALIIAIGAQNAFVLRQGLARDHVGTVIAICALSDALLIVAGVAGLGALVRRAPLALEVLRWGGAAYLAAYAVRAFVRAARPVGLAAARTTVRTRAGVVAAALAFTYLNPHVYIDTVLLLGALGTQFGDARWWFAAGASTASLTWFSALGLGARALSRRMASPMTWRVLDVAIGVVMVVVAVTLVRADLA